MIGGKDWHQGGRERDKGHCNAGNVTKDEEVSRAIMTSAHHNGLEGQLHDTDADAEEQLQSTRIKTDTRLIMVV